MAFSRIETVKDWDYNAQISSWLSDDNEILFLQLGAQFSAQLHVQLSDNNDILLRGIEKAWYF